MYLRDVSNRRPAPGVYCGVHLQEGALEARKHLCSALTHGMSMNNSKFLSMSARETRFKISGIFAQTRVYLWSLQTIWVIVTCPVGAERGAGFSKIALILVNPKP